jgi:hypothetical protein
MFGLPLHWVHVLGWNPLEAFLPPKRWPGEAPDASQPKRSVLPGLPDTGALTLACVQTTGKISAVWTRIINATSIGGIWIPCAGQVTPWGTHLGGEWTALPAPCCHATPGIWSPTTVLLLAACHRRGRV